jgi:hypothetical protein
MRPSAFGHDLSVPDKVIAAGDCEVVVTQTNHVTYLLASLVAWPLSLFLMDDSGGLAPSKKYRVALVNEEGRVLWSEVPRGPASFAVADKIAEQVVRVGIEDCLFKKEHGWRID